MQIACKGVGVNLWIYSRLLSSGKYYSTKVFGHWFIAVHVKNKLLFEAQVDWQPILTYATFGCKIFAGCFSSAGTLQSVVVDTCNMTNAGRHVSCVGEFKQAEVSASCCLLAEGQGQGQLKGKAVSKAYWERSAYLSQESISRATHPPHKTLVNLPMMEVH